MICPKGKCTNEIKSKLCAPKRDVASPCRKIEIGLQVGASTIPKNCPNTGHHRLYTIGKIVKQTELPKVGSIWQHGATLPTGFFALKRLCFDNLCWTDSKTKVKHRAIKASYSKHK